MPIFNVNMFQEGLSKDNFLLEYTDQYLKQALANLGQRFSIKGDSIYSDSFSLKELFPTYAGNWNTPGLCANFRVIRNDNNTFKLKAELVKWTRYVNKVTQNEYYKFDSLDDGSDSSQYTFEVTTINNVIQNIIDEGYDDKIALENELQINDTDYWDANNAAIIKYDDGYLFKIKGMKNEVVKEGIIEYISNEGKLIDGIRIICDQEDLYLDNKSNPNFYILWIHYDKASAEYVLSAIKVNVDSFTYGENDTISDIVNSLYDILAGYESSSLSLNVFSTIDDIINSLYSNEDYALTDLGKAVLNYNTEVSQYYTLSSNNNIKELSTTYINEYLVYFAQDVANLFPRIETIYNEIKYEDETNIKIYKQIFGSLLMTVVYRNLIVQHNKFDETDSDISEFVATLPVDYEIVYNVNSNDGSIIYNSINNISVQYVENINGADTDIYNVELIDSINKVANSTFDENEEPINDNAILVHSWETKTVLYQFTITYIEDNIINQIFWFEAFSLPYVNAAGNWNINGIDTDVYAYGRDAKKTNFVIISSELDNARAFSEEYTTSAKITHNLISDPYDIKNMIPETSWTPYTAKVPYLAGANTDEIDDSTYYMLQADLPSKEFINTLTDDTKFSYLQNTIFINLLSPTTEKDAWEIVDKQYSYIDGYESYYDSELEKIVYVKYDARKDTLGAKIGPKGVVTTFWTIEYDNSTNTYEFTYLKRPGQRGLALDMTYLCNVDNITKYYMSETIEPDKYEHDWLVFSQTNKLYKNNDAVVSEKTTVWPVMMPLSSEYYIGDYGDSSSNDVTESIFSNELNFSLQFFNNIKKDDTGLINYVGQNEEAARYFEIRSTNTSYNIPKNPDEYFQADPNDDDFIEKSLTFVESYTYSIAGAINYTKYPNEYIPNAVNPTVGNKQSFPMFDLSEILLRNTNTLNRTNILAIGKKQFNSNTLYPLYYAYIGSSFDDEDKSILHIGTANTNPNLGTKTMTDDISITRMNPMEKLSLDFNDIDIKGNTIISGDLGVGPAIWKKNIINYNDKDVEVFSTIITPMGIHELKYINASEMLYNNIDITTNGTDGKQMSTANAGKNNHTENMNDYNSPDYLAKTFSSYQRYDVYPDSAELLSTIKYELPSGVTSKKTRYFTPPDGFDYITTSYLNLSRLFKEHNLFQNTYFTITSDKQLTYHTYTTENQNVGGDTTKYNTVYYLALSTDLTDTENDLIQIEENNEKSTIKVANPIQISYTKTREKAVTFKDKLVSYLTYIWPLKYEEVWTCEGCSLCNAYTCDLIKVCNKSTMTYYVDYVWGRVLVDDKDKVPANGRAFPVKRYMTKYDMNTGSTTTTEFSYNVYFPNPVNEYRDSLTWNGKDTYTWFDEYLTATYSLQSSTSPGPKYAFMPTGSIKFELNYEDAKTNFEKYSTATYNIVKVTNSTYYDGNDVKHTNGITYKITYVGEDSKEHDVVFDYKKLTKSDSQTHTLISEDGEKVMEENSYVGVDTTIPIQFSFEYKDGTIIDEDAEVFVDSVYINIREVLTPHSTPASTNSVASLNGINSDDAILGTNKYK